METVIRINRLGLNLLFPIHFKNREHGVSKIPKIEILRTLFNVSKLFLKAFKFNYFTYLQKLSLLKFLYEYNRCIKH